MTSKWRKAKAALGLNLCVYIPKTLDGGGEAALHISDDGDGDGDGGSSLSPPTPLSASASASTTPTSTRSTKSPSPTTTSSKKTCAICLGTMKAGHGHAIFTAECSHAFHFNCIASNVKHGNQVCPVCRAKWKEVPFQRPTDIPHGKIRISPLSWQQDDICMAVSRQLNRNDAHRQIPSLSLIPEPGVFNDDEPVDHQTVTLSKCPGIGDGFDKSYTKSVDIKVYAEVSAVPQSTSRDNFNILINLKAPVTTLKFNLDENHVNLPLSLQTSRAPVDLVTVLDVSGSMAGTKLALLKRAMGFVIQSLGPSDRLSVIAFSSTARRLFALCRMTDAGRQRALQAVNSLGSNGGTNIAEGLRKGAKVMEERREKNPVGSIILLSDGQDTYSLSFKDRAHKRPEYQSLLPFSVREGCNDGFQIPVHAFGFGADHDAASMHSISEASGGTFSFIEAEGVIQDAFAQCIGGLLSVVVQDLRVCIECMHPDIRLGPLKAGSYTTQVVNGARTAFIDVGDLYADEVRDFLVSVNVPLSTDSEETMLVKVHGVYRDPVSKETLTSNIKELRIQRPESVGKQVVSIVVDRQRNRVQAASAMAEARVAAERGDLSSGVAILESFRRVLSETISAQAGDQLCVALDAELKEMQERMASRHTYEASGRAYVLSGLSSHSWQRATARGDSTDSTSLLHAYQTPSMVDMVTRSQTLVLGGSSSQPPVRPARSFSLQPQRRRLGHRNSTCPFAETTSDLVVDLLPDELPNTLAPEAAIHHTLERNAALVQTNSASTSSHNPDLMALNEIMLMQQLGPATSMEILANQIHGLQTNDQLPYQPIPAYSNLNLPTISQFYQLASNATIIDLPQLLSSAGLPSSEYNAQEAMAINTAVEPYIPMEITPSQARDFQQSHMQLQLSHQAYTVAVNPPPTRPTGIVFREPTLQIEPARREEPGRGKRPMIDESDERAKKKTKIQNPANENESVRQLVDHLMESSTPANLCNVGETSAAAPIRSTAMPLRDFTGQNFPINLEDLDGIPTALLSEDLQVALATERSLELGESNEHGALLNLNATTVPDNITRLGPLTAQSAARPTPNGANVTRFVPIQAMLHEIYSGGRGRRQME